MASAASCRSARSSTSRAGRRTSSRATPPRRSPRSSSRIVGRKLRLKILEVNRKANRLILSEKVALYEERREKRDELFSSLQVGQKVTGTVRSIAPFGVFIDLGGIDGLVHKSELSWNKVNNPEAGYRVGEEVEAEVIDINHERGRISLSIRRLQPDPWHSTVADFKVGDIIDGTVTKLVNFGAFVRVRDGLEGLIHISELSHQRVAHPGDVVHEGQTLKLKIISLDSERHRLGLSLKQAEEPPARPAPEPAPPRRDAERAERSERRPRPERGYSLSDAVQEPEGGIDNTLAAAFAQVREQVAAAEEAAWPRSRAEAAAPRPRRPRQRAAEAEAPPRRQPSRGRARRRQPRPRGGRRRGRAPRQPAAAERRDAPRPEGRGRGRAAEAAAEAERRAEAAAGGREPEADAERRGAAAEADAASRSRGRRRRGRRRGRPTPRPTPRLRPTRRTPKPSRPTPRPAARPPSPRRSRSPRRRPARPTTRGAADDLPTSSGCRRDHPQGARGRIHAVPARTNGSAASRTVGQSAARSRC